MSAQTNNDPLSAFAYPQDNNSTGNSATVPTSTPIIQQPVMPIPVEKVVETKPLDDIKKEVRGTETDGPEPIKTETFSEVKPVDPQIKEDVPEDKDTKESPLQSLARKLSKLREELVQEVPVSEPEAKTDSGLTPIDQGTKPLEESPKLDEPLFNVVDASVNNLSQVPENLTSAIDPLAANTNQPTPLESIIPGIAIPNNSQTNLTPEINSTITPTPTDTNVNMPSDPLATLNAAIEKKNTSGSPDEFTIDENDNSMVSAQNVEVASTGSKYPLNINKILDMAIERNASDIQVSVGYPVMIRIDGTLIEANPQIVSPTNAEELIMPVLTEQKKELLEVNREVDLAYSPLQNQEARFRINAYYSKGNLTAAFRLIPAKIRTIEELMLPPIYNQIIKLAQGLVLVTGPTGHGKSTTLAAMLQSINISRAVHMITIEDPIEYMFKPAKAVIDQREMHDDTHSWTVALKSALRQDPDVILVGEMRDYETIASTITLAETGHLVFATLHTNSAAQTVDRIIDVFPENQQAQIRTQLANILEAVIAQRLIPIDGGGRRAVSEIMLGTPAVRNLIREGKTHQLDNVIRTSADVGMFSLEQSLVRLVRDGLITMERAQEYAVHPEEVVRLLKT